jgi:hypothetical protein
MHNIDSSPVAPGGDTAVTATAPPPGGFFEHTYYSGIKMMRTNQARRAEGLALFVFMWLFAAMIGISLYFSVLGK